MSGKVSDLPIRYKRAVFTQKKYKIHQVSRVVGHVHGHMILGHMVLTKWQ